MLEVIKSYLVSLGFQVDNNTFNQSQKAVKDMDKTMTAFTTGAAKNFAVAGAAVTSFFVAAEVGIAKYMAGLAKADLENEMFARKMWMNKDSAIAYKNSLSALGAELQDLYLSPELLDRFNRLREQATELAAPEEYNEQMKKIRDVTFEFQRMKLEMTYSIQWIAYYLFKYLEKPINSIRDAMGAMNDKISKDMPHWTKQVAQVLSWVVRLGEAGAWAIGNIIKVLDQLSPKTKVAGSAFVGFFALLKMGPIGWIIAGLTALLLLLDDYKTYQEGGDSLFSDSWAQLDKLKQTMEEDGTFKKFKSSLDSVSDSLLGILGSLGDIGEKIATGLGFKSFSDMLMQGTLTTLKSLETALQGIAGALEIIDGILSGDGSKLQSGADKFSKSMNKIMFGNEKGEKLNSAMDNFDKGNYSGAASDIGGMLSKWFWGDEDLANSINGNIKDSLTGFRDFLNSIFVSPKLNYSEHATGGIQTAPHLGLIAEEYPESIIPLDPKRRNNSINLLAQTAGLLGVPMFGNSSSIVNNYKVTNSPQFKIYGSEPTATAREISRTYDYGLLTRNFRGAYN